MPPGQGFRTMGCKVARSIRSFGRGQFDRFGHFWSFSSLDWGSFWIDLVSFFDRYWFAFDRYSATTHFDRYSSLLVAPGHSKSRVFWDFWRKLGPISIKNRSIRTPKRTKSINLTPSKCVKNHRKNSQNAKTLIPNIDQKQFVNLHRRKPKSINPKSTFGGFKGRK